jgi:hypothetical protein
LTILLVMRPMMLTHREYAYQPALRAGRLVRGMTAS